MKKFLSKIGKKRIFHESVYFAKFYENGYIFSPDVPVWISSIKFSLVYVC